MTTTPVGPPRTGPADPAVAGPLLLGVRHHGPGSARAVRAALDHHLPDAVLIEGPPEADVLAALAGHPDTRPPVALLAYVTDDPGRAAFWPLAEFSPEWVALRWALERDVPVRFLDLPAAHTLALPEPAPTDAEPAPRDAAPGAAPARPGPAPAARLDPLAALAAAAGHDDAERWWEDVFEHRGHPPSDSGVALTDAARDPLAPFAALAEAMTALRTHRTNLAPAPDRSPSTTVPEADIDPAPAPAAAPGSELARDLLREAAMRLRLREARRTFGDRVAVVCGAWHVPALARAVPVAADRRLLKGLPKVRTTTTWVPWTHRRLARRSGYGAGIDSPGWYEHLHACPDRPVERWMTRAARLLRQEDHPVSSAHVIEAVRLAGTLAALRGRPLAGLGEATDAVRAVMGDGSDVAGALVHERLVVGERMGAVPDTAPAVPLQRDLDRTRRSLRLKPEAAERDLDLDLRQETDAARSRLLHRLSLLDVPWGVPAHSRGSTGTFRERWRLRWEPELSVRVAEAGVWGTTVPAAALARARARATAATTLADVTTLAEHCLLAGLPEALPEVLRALVDRAALDTDVGHLAAALPALVRSVRYGDVRGTDARALTAVAAGLAERVFVALPPACVGLDDAGAAQMREHLESTHTAVTLLSRAATPGEGRDGERAGSVKAPPAARWAAVLASLARRDAVPGLLRGRALRLLLDDGAVDEEGTLRLMRPALSPGTPPAEAASWVAGFLGADDGGLLLVHDTRLLALLDGWLAGVPAAAFQAVLPLLRRTFSGYAPAVRRNLGERIRTTPTAVLAARTPGEGPAVEEAPPGFGPGLDRDRAAAVLPTLGFLLEGDAPASTASPSG